MRNRRPSIGTVESPCTKVCRIEHSVCVGCKRTIDEIRHWSIMTQQQQTELKDNLKRRNKKMAKININGTDVYTDDFNEEQEKVFVEIQQLDSEIRRSEYLVAIMKDRQSNIAQQLLPQEEVAEVTPKETKKSKGE